MIDLTIYLSLVLLFGIAAQFRAMDGYSFLRRTIYLLEQRIGILYAVALIAPLITKVWFLRLSSFLVVLLRDCW